MVLYQMVVTHMVKLLFGNKYPSCYIPNESSYRAEKYVENHLKNRLVYRLLWSFENIPFLAFFRQVVIANNNDGIMKPLAEIARNGLEYYSPVNFESIDAHFDIVPLECHMGGIPWTHMVS